MLNGAVHDVGANAKGAELVRLIEIGDIDRGPGRLDVEISDRYEANSEGSTAFVFGMSFAKFPPSGEYGCA